ncbi:type I restriction modification DNA specificity protein [Sulfuritortus calidifontis]|uniref:Type I restriction modification DNA specificity protein n=1 Tax=Sulfuritortus calidifontis TaxID=1914471 RepID=A0A4R3JX16_9PROT|nr:type I restriction modification DNA specificity protein [Sulfuritortus calidifontis]
MFASYLIRFRPKKEILTKYFYYYLKSPAYWDAIGASKSGIAVPNVNASKLSQVPIPVAPLDQQKRIVAEIEKQFSRLDQAVANLKRVKANLKRYKAAVLKAAVEGRLVETEAELARREGRSIETGAQLLQRILETRRRQWNGKGKYKEPAAPDTTDLPELPEGWVYVSLDQLTTQIADVDHKMPKPFEGGIPYVSTRDFIGESEIDFDGAKHISPSDFENLCKKVRPVRGDILLSRYGTVGEVRTVETDLPFQASYSMKPPRYSVPLRSRGFGYFCMR